MSYNKFLNEFPKRTKEIIDSYYQEFSNQIEKDEGYEITLLLNCMLGLAIFTETTSFESLSTGVVFKEKFDKIEGIEITGCNVESRAVKFAAYQLRNTMAHIGDFRKIYTSDILLNNEKICAENNDYGTIKMITFICQDRRGDWSIKINLDKNKFAFKEFLLRFCEIVSPPNTVAPEKQTIEIEKISTKTVTELPDD